ncbi:hypothetical protein ACOSP6_12805 [Tenacibaculum sp. MEBiC06402]|uniref:hypothetical protein n=1 Tax=unclassified Tenacibaculum TaxID=2635139 RepID=UPI003B9CFD6F
MKKQTNYKNWSFRLLIYVILLNTVIAYLITAYQSFADKPDVFYLKKLPLALLTSLLFAVGIVFTVLSVNNKEEKDYKYYISVYGYPIFIIFTILTSLF